MEGPTDVRVEKVMFYMSALGPQLQNWIFGSINIIYMVIFTIHIIIFHQSNPKCLKGRPLLNRKLIWQKLVKMSFLGKIIDIKWRNFLKKFQKR